MGLVWLVPSKGNDRALTRGGGWVRKMLWLFPRSVRGFLRKTPGKSRKLLEIFPESRSATIRSRPGKPNQRAKTTSSISPIFVIHIELLFRNAPGKVHELAFLWFGLLGRLLIQILGFRAPGKANLPAKPWHCPDLVPTFRAGCFLKSTVPAFTSFSEHRGGPELSGQHLLLFVHGRMLH